MNLNDLEDWICKTKGLGNFKVKIEVEGQWDDLRGIDVLLEEEAIILSSDEREK